ncbi:MAG: D-alanyl-D-alanine carboxypeptidase [Pseudomonadota bacterium]
MTPSSTASVRRHLAVLLCVCALAPAVLVSQAHAASKHAAMAMDANTGKILHNRSGDAPRYPASLTKMMTLYMVFDLIERNRLSYSSKITISAQAASQPPSKLGLKVGDKISVSNAAKALVTKSANDVAVAVAEHIAGSEANFARLMTKTARDLGMKNTTFKNASGLPNSAQKTTARDMLTLALALQDNHAKHYRLFKTKRFSYRGKTYRNHNSLLGRVAGVDGIKTGYIRASGFNLVTSARKDGKHVVAAVFGGKSSRARNASMRSLIASSLKRASTRKTRRPRPMLIAQPKRIAPPRRMAGLRASPPSAAPMPTRAPVVNTAAQVGRPITSSRTRSQADVRLNRNSTAHRRFQPKIQIAQVKRVSVMSTRQNLGATRTRPEQTNPRPIEVTRAGLPPIASSNDVARGRQQFRPTTQARTAPGRPPSTLQDQLANLLAKSGVAEKLEPGRRVAAYNPAARTRPMTATNARAKGHYLVQIGAYKTRAEAEARLADLAAREGQLLRGFSRLATPVATGQRQLYRARFAGFTAAMATKTCTELRRRAIDCFVATSN